MGVSIWFIEVLEIKKVGVKKWFATPSRVIIAKSVTLEVCYQKQRFKKSVLLRKNSPHMLQVLYENQPN